MSEMAGRQEESGWAGESQLRSLRTATPRFEGAAVEPLEEKSSQGSHSSRFPLPGAPPGLDEVHFPAHRVLFFCRLPGALCIHQPRTKAERAFTFENPLVFYFLPAPSQHLSEKNRVVAERFAVCEAVQAAQLGLVALLSPS